MRAASDVFGSFKSHFPWREAALSSLLGESIFEIRSKRLQRGLLGHLTLGRPLLSKLSCAEDGTIVYLHSQEFEGSPYPGSEFMVGVLNKRCVLPPF